MWIILVLSVQSPLALKIQFFTHDQALQSRSHDERAFSNGGPMTTNRYAAASFAVNIDHLHALGVRDPYSKQSLQLYHSGKLNANERLYFSLWGSSELSTSLIRAKTRFARQGEPVSSAFFVIKGQVLGVQGDQIYRLGPGSVIGLAEGVGGLACSMDAIAVDDV